MEQDQPNTATMPPQYPVPEVNVTLSDPTARTIHTLARPSEEEAQALEAMRRFHAWPVVKGWLERSRDEMRERIEAREQDSPALRGASKNVSDFLKATSEPQAGSTADNPMVW